MSDSKRRGLVAVLVVTTLMELVIGLACVDTTPIVLPDDDLDASADAKSPCIECIEAPGDAGEGCADKYAACNDLAKCEAAIACAYQAGCFDLPTIADLVSCGVACGEDNQLATDSESLQAATALFTCIIGPCKDVCGQPLADASAD
jgi:hypothetical protein